MIERITSQPWTTKLDEIMSDGEWHDGRGLVREAEKQITPGVAVRKYAALRAKSKRDRGTLRHVEIDPDDEFISSLPGADLDLGDDKRSLGARIAIGKHSIMRRAVSARLLSDRWEMRPDGRIISPQQWREGGWEVRDRSVGWMSVKEAARLYPVSPETLGHLVRREPALPCQRIGRLTRIHRDVLPVLSERVAEYLEEAAVRRSEASKRNWVGKPRVDETRVTLTDLSDRYQISVRTVRVIKEANPDLGWTTFGRATYLPVEALGQWEEALKNHLFGSSKRRSDAMKRARSRDRSP